MTEGLSNRERKAYCRCRADCARSVYLDLAVGQSSGHIGQHGPIPPQITDAAAHGAKPVYVCLVIEDRRPSTKLENPLPKSGPLKLLVRVLCSFSSAP